MMLQSISQLLNWMKSEAIEFLLLVLRKGSTGDLKVQGMDESTLKKCLYAIFRLSRVNECEFQAGW